MTLSRILKVFCWSLPPFIPQLHYFPSTFPLSLCLAIFTSGHNYYLFHVSPQAIVPSPRCRCSNDPQSVPSRQRPGTVGPTSGGFTITKAVGGADALCTGDVVEIITTSCLQGSVAITALCSAPRQTGDL